RLIIAAIQQVRGLLANHPAHHPAACQHPHALRGQDAGIDAADAVEVNVAVVVDVDDGHADFVGVANDHHAERAAALERGNYVVVDVGADVTTKAADIRAPHSLEPLLETGRAGH